METRTPHFDIDDSYDVTVLLDADGCVFNPFLHFLKMNLLAQYGDKIWRFWRKENLTVEEQQRVDSIFAAMTSDLDKLISFNAKENKLQVPTYNKDELQRLSKIILEKGGYQSDDEEQREAFVTDSLQHFQEALKKLKPEFVNTLLYKANQPLFNEIGAFCEGHHVTKIKLGSFSARQSESNDVYNSDYYGTGLFRATLPTLQEIFNSGLLPFSITCELDDYVLEKDLQEKIFFDHTKLAILYAILNRPSARKNIFIIRDDRQDILLGLTQILTCYPELVFKDDVVLLLEYDGHYKQHHRKNRAEPTPFIARGVGKQRDGNYVNNLLEIKKLWNAQLQEQGKVNRLIAEALARDAIASFLKKRKLNLNKDPHQFFSRNNTPIEPVRKVHGSRRCTLV